MPLIIVNRYHRSDLVNNPEYTFVFGDNMVGKGLGGQAGACRGEPNAFGIPTKWTPEHSDVYDPNIYFHDDDPRIYGVELMIRNSLIVLQSLIHEGNTVVWPADGIGTGLSKWQDYCPNLLRKVEWTVHTFIPQEVTKKENIRKENL